MFPMKRPMKRYDWIAITLHYFSVTVRAAIGKVPRRDSITCRKQQADHSAFNHCFALHLAIYNEVPTLLLCKLARDCPQNVTHGSVGGYPLWIAMKQEGLSERLWRLLFMPTMMPFEPYRSHCTIRRCYSESSWNVL